jgi:hypothetical protein
LPAHYDAGIFRAFHEHPMEQSSADTQAEILIIWKRRLSFEFIVQKTYAAERRSMLRAQLHANPTQGCDPVGHQAFGANFVDERARPIRDNNLKAALAGGKRRSKSGWTSSNDEDIGFRGHGIQVHQGTNIISRQAPGPIGNGKTNIPRVDT